MAGGLSIAKQNKSPHDIVHRLFPETKLRISNVEQRSSKVKQNIRNYTRTGNSTKIGIVHRGMVHEQILSEQLNAKIIPYTVKAMAQCNKVIYIGPFSSRHVRRLRQLNRFSPSTQVYIWWIGTDVFNAIHRINGYNIRMVQRLKNVTHLCVSETLKSELESIGIKADVVTLVPDISGMEPLPLPKKYTVAVYMPSTHLDFYKYGDIKKVVKALPEIDFIFYGNKEPLDVATFSNVKVMGWVKNTKVVFKNCSCLLRLAVHDGFAKSAIEAVMYDRYVITNHKLPHVKYCKNYKDAITVLKKRPKLSKSTREYYSSNYSMKKIKSIFGGR